VIGELAFAHAKSAELPFFSPEDFAKVNVSIEAVVFDKTNSESFEGKYYLTLKGVSAARFTVEAKVIRENEIQESISESAFSLNHQLTNILDPRHVNELILQQPSQDKDNYYFGKTIYLSLVY